MLDFSFRHWREHSPYLKAYLALTLERVGRTDDARLVFDSVMDSAKTDDDLGTYWAPEDRAWLWYNDTIETHAFALRTLMELSPKDARREGLVQWLFLNKKLNHWKSTRATAEVIYALVHYLRGEGALGVTETVDVTVGRRERSLRLRARTSVDRRPQLVLAGDEIDPATDSTVMVEKQGPGLVFASATWHFSTEQLPESGSGDLFGVTRTYFRRVDRASGPALVPLEEGATAAPRRRGRGPALAPRPPRGRVRPPPRPAGRRPRARVPGLDAQVGPRHRLVRGGPRQRQQLLLRAAPRGRVHLQVPPAGRHGRQLPRRPRHRRSPCTPRSSPPTRRERC